MAQHVYEGMFILDSSRFARDAEGVSGKVEQMITAAGGEILVSRLWEERRLAYPIKNHRKGTYWLIYFRLDSLKLKELQRQLEIEDSVIRNLMLKVDPRLVDTMVSHAQAGDAVAPEAVAEAGAESEAEAEAEKTVGAAESDEK